MVVLFGEGRLGIGCGDMVWVSLGLTLAFILNWLFYKPMFGCRHDRQDAHPWQQYWGESYGPELKRWLLEPVFGKLETEGKIGNLIIDVGSGASPVTRLVKTPIKLGCFQISYDPTSRRRG